MKKSRPLNDLEMHEILRLLYPEHIKSDEDEFFELSQEIGETYISLGNGVDVTLAQLLGKVVMLTMPLESELTANRYHCLGEIKYSNSGFVHMTAAVTRDITFTE
jgi:hypothetical protein